MRRSETMLPEAIRELSRMAMRISLEDVRILVYDLEHAAPLSPEYALALAFLAWRKQLEQLEKKKSQPNT